MKKRNNNRFAVKNGKFTKKVILSAVSFLLILLMGISGTVSWIEDVSQVEFSTDNDSQETPLHIGSNILYSDAAMKNMNSTSVDLNKYFQKSGAMHLSPCYGNGEDFYFPVENGTGFRTGTKDDVNVNYLSVTFRVQSWGASTAYWFEKITDNLPYVTFKDTQQIATNAECTVLEKYLRCSITVDGATNVYAVDDAEETGYQKIYKTIENNTVVSKTGRSIEEFSYCQEKFLENNNPDTEKNEKLANQGGGNNLNGNTLFTVSPYDDRNKAATVKTVTVKIWLESGAYNGSIPDTGVDLSSINLNIVSGWEKKRRIYVVDKTISQWDDGLNNNQGDFTGANWLTNSGALFWAINGNEENQHWGKDGNVTDAKTQFFDIPAVYNNVSTTLYRCNDEWNVGNAHSPVNYWDKYPTVFPNTFHDETFTVYTKTFATWEPDDKVHCVYFINSAYFSNSKGVYDYMWDSHSVINHSDINAKVVKNANWPGLKMDTIVKKKVRDDDTEEKYVYAFFYNSEYDRIIFNDGDFEEGQNHEYQTQDLYLTEESTGNPLSIVNGTFDMATLTWFHTNPSATTWDSRIPSYSSANTYLQGNFSTGDVWKKTHFAYGGEYSSTADDAMQGTTSSNMIAKVYNKVSKDTHKLYFKNNDSWSTVKAHFWNDNEGLTEWPGNEMTLDKGVYVIDIPDGATHVQFNDGTESKKIDNITINPGMVYNNGNWEDLTSDYKFDVYYNGTCYKTYSGAVNLYAGNSIILGKEDYYVEGHLNDGNYKYSSDVYAKSLKHNTVYRFYLSDVQENTITITLAEGEAHTTN